MRPELKCGYEEQAIAVGEEGGGGAGGHGGGDERLVEDFVAVMRGEAASSGITRIEESVVGHQLVFAAVRAAMQRRVIERQPPDVAGTPVQAEEHGIAGQT